MREQLAKYVELLFAGNPASEDMMREILQNTLEKYDDYIEQGKAPEAAYRLAIAGIGDISELLGQEKTDPRSPADNSTDWRGRPLKPMWKKVLTAIAIGLYILCAVPVIILSEAGYETLGLVGTISIAAVATVLIIIGSGSEKEDDDDADDTKDRPQHPVQKCINTILDVIGLAVYLIISFHTGAWHITWLIFPIMAAVNGIVNAISDLVRRDHQ